MITELVPSLQLRRRCEQLAEVEENHLVMDEDEKHLDELEKKEEVLAAMEKKQELVLDVKNKYDELDEMEENHGVLAETENLRNDKNKEEIIVNDGEAGASLIDNNEFGETDNETETSPKVEIAQNLSMEQSGNLEVSVSLQNDEKTDSKTEGTEILDDMSDGHAQNTQATQSNTSDTANETYIDLNPAKPFIEKVSTNKTVLEPPQTFTCFTCKKTYTGRNQSQGRKKLGRHIKRSSRCRMNNLESKISKNLPMKQVDDKEFSESFQSNTNTHRKEDGTEVTDNVDDDHGLKTPVARPNTCDTANDTNLNIQVNPYFDLSTPSPDEDRASVSQPAAEGSQILPNIEATTSQDSSATVCFGEPMEIDKDYSSDIVKHSDGNSLNWRANCPKCKKYYTEKTKLKHHVLTHFVKEFEVIPESKPYSCPICQAEHDQRYLLLYHYAYHHQQLYKLTNLKNKFLKMRRGKQGKIAAALAGRLDKDMWSHPSLLPEVPQPLEVFPLELWVLQYLALQPDCLEGVLHLLWGKLFGFRGERGEVVDRRKVEDEVLARYCSYQDEADEYTLKEESWALVGVDWPFYSTQERLRFLELAPSTDTASTPANNIDKLQDMPLIQVLKQPYFQDVPSLLLHVNKLDKKLLFFLRKDGQNTRLNSLGLFFIKPMLFFDIQESNRFQAYRQWEQPITPDVRFSLLNQVFEPTHSFLNSLSKDPRGVYNNVVFPVILLLGISEDQFNQWLFHEKRHTKRMKHNESKPDNGPEPYPFLDTWDCSLDFCSFANPREDRSVQYVNIFEMYDLEDIVLYTMASCPKKESSADPWPGLAWVRKNLLHHLQKVPEDERVNMENAIVETVRKFYNEETNQMKPECWAYCKELIFFFDWPMMELFRKNAEDYKDVVASIPEWKREGTYKEFHTILKVLAQQPETACYDIETLRDKVDQELGHKSKHFLKFLAVMSKENDGTRVLRPSFKSFLQLGKGSIQEDLELLMTILDDCISQGINISQLPWLSPQAAMENYCLKSLWLTTQLKVLLRELKDDPKNKAEIYLLMKNAKFTFGKKLSIKDKPLSKIAREMGSSQTEKPQSCPLTSTSASCFLPDLLRGLPILRCPSCPLLTVLSKEKVTLLPGRLHTILAHLQPALLPKELEKGTAVKLLPVPSPSPILQPSVRHLHQEGLLLVSLLNPGPGFRTLFRGETIGMAQMARGLLPPLALPPYPLPLILASTPKAYLPYLLEQGKKKEVVLQIPPLLPPGLHVRLLLPTSHLLEQLPPLLEVSPGDDLVVVVQPSRLLQAFLTLLQGELQLEAGARIGQVVVVHPEEWITARLQGRG